MPVYFERIHEQFSRVGFGALLAIFGAASGLEAFRCTVPRRPASLGLSGMARHEGCSKMESRDSSLSRKAVRS